MSGAMERIGWGVDWRLEKRRGLWLPEEINAGEAPVPDEILEWQGNLLTYGGSSAMWHRLTGGVAVTAFDNANSRLGVGDSTTAEAATQTDLQASTNKLRKVVDATYPQHTDGTGAASNAQVVVRATFIAGEAEWGTGWQEVAWFNAATAGRMMNRKVVNLGVKSGGSWTLQGSLTVGP